MDEASSHVLDDSQWEDAGVVAHQGTAVGRTGADERHPVVARPALLETLAAGARVTLVSAPAGSGKTWLLRSWVADPDVEERVAWVSVSRDERDPQRFWVAVVGALRTTAAGSHVVRALTAGADFDPGDLVERLREDARWAGRTTARPWLS